MPAASARKPRKSPKPRRKTPKPADAAQRKFEKTFRPLVERMVSDAIEDRIDALDGMEALRESGETGHDEFWKRRPFGQSGRALRAAVVVAVFAAAACATAPVERPPEAPPAALAETPPVARTETPPAPRANDVIVCVYEGWDAQFVRRDELGVDLVPVKETPEWQRRQQEEINQGIDPEVWGPR